VKHVTRVDAGVLRSNLVGFSPDRLAGEDQRTLLRTQGRPPLLLFWRQVSRIHRRRVPRGRCRRFAGLPRGRGRHGAAGHRTSGWTSGGTTGTGNERDWRYPPSSGFRRSVAHRPRHFRPKKSLSM